MRRLTLAALTVILAGCSPLIQADTPKGTKVGYEPGELEPGIYAPGSPSYPKAIEACSWTLYAGKSGAIVDKGSIGKGSNEWVNLPYGTRFDTNCAQYFLLRPFEGVR